MEAPDPNEYLDEPEYTDDQDDDQGNVLQFARGFVTPTAPRTFDEALAWLAHESIEPSQNWAGLCQKCMRSADGCPGGFASAKDQWFGMAAQYRFVGADPKDAPIGADIFSMSRNPDSSSFRFGHIAKKARPFNHGAIAIWSTDAVRVGHVDKVGVDLYDRWNHEVLGWGYQINGLVIDLKDPKPAQTEKYVVLSRALVNIDQTINNYQTARATAKRLEEWGDHKQIQSLIEDAWALRRRTRKKLENMRHAA
jgi:hypothetical protein